jgi:hypothetical protein
VQSHASQPPHDAWADDEREKKRGHGGTGRAKGYPLEQS